jgi:hypothetical protein
MMGGGVPFLPRDASLLDAKRAGGAFFYQELKNKRFFNELMLLMDILG